MITFDIILIAAEITLITVFALLVSRLDFTPGSPNPVIPLFNTYRETDRPQGVQEEDLPRFVFRSPAPSAQPA